MITEPEDKIVTYSEDEVVEQDREEGTKKQLTWSNNYDVVVEEPDNDESCWEACELESCAEKDIELETFLDKAKPELDFIALETMLDEATTIAMKQRTETKPEMKDNNEDKSVVQVKVNTNLAHFH